MFIVNIAVSGNITEQQQATLFIQHVAWFKKYFMTGQFVLVGPYSDRERSGVILAHTKNREELLSILSEDAYYPKLAEYDIREFSPKMIAENLQQFQES